MVKQMKKLFALALAVISFAAYACQDEIRIVQRDVTDTLTYTRQMCPPNYLTLPSIMVQDPNTQQIVMANFTGMTWNGTTLSVNSSGAQSDWNATSGAAQILNKPTLSAVATTGLFSDLLSKPTTISGYGITDAVSASALTSVLAGYATSSALTSGLAGKFNTPIGTTSQYVRGDGSLATLPVGNAGTVTSITAGSGLSGGTITTSGTISLPNVGTAGNYSGVTTDAQGRVTAGTSRSFSTFTPTLNTCFQISATRDAKVSFGVDVTVSVTLGGTPKGSVYLRYYTDNACTLGQQTIISGSSGLPSTLSVVVGLQNLGTISLSGEIPGGTWVRVETSNDSGTPTFAPRQGQVVLE